MVGIQDRTGGGASSLVTGIDFDEWGQRKRLTFGSGAYSDWSTQDLGTHLKTWTIGYTTGGLGDPGNPRQYTYNSIEQLTKAGEWGPLQHDALGQLVHAAAPGMGVSSMDFAHDGFGNNISHRVQGTAGASFNNFDFPALATNQIPAMTTTGGLTGWSMNPQGRAIQIGTGTSTGATLGLGWDGLGQLASVTSAAGTQWYAYAPTGLRVQVQDSLSPARNRRYAYSSGGLLMSEFTQAGWKRDVVYLGSEAVAEVDEAGVHELHNDHLGTPRIVTGRATRMIEGRQAFGPYGEALAAQTEGYRPLTGYTGHLQTEDTGLIYMRGRYYSPAWHRFLNSDQGADPSTWNQVAYVAGSPFMATDPSGMAGNQLKCVLKTTTWWAVSESGYRWITEIYRSIECTVIEGDPGGELGVSPSEPQTPQPDKKSKYWDCIQANFGSTGITKDFMLGLANGASAVLDPTGLTGIAIGTAQLNDLSTNSAMDNGIGAMSLGAGTAGFVNQIRQINGAGRALGWAGRTVTASTWIRGVPGLNKALAAVSAVSSAVTIGAKAQALHEHCSKEAGL